MKKLLSLILSIICILNCACIYSFAENTTQANEISSDNFITDSISAENDENNNEEISEPTEDVSDDGEEKPTIYVTSITPTNPAKKSIELAVCQTRQLKIKIKPSSAKKYISWSVKDKKIASVSKNGLVTGKKAGKTTVTVAATDDSGKSITYNVKVNARKSGNHLSTKSCTVVKTKKTKYPYKQLYIDIKNLRKKYPDLFHYKTVGKSYDKRNIYELIIGNQKSKNKIFVQASVHAREYINSMLVMKQVEVLCENYYKGTYRGKYYNELLQNCCFYIIPMANPDGVSISIHGASGIKDKKLRSGVKKMCKKYGKGKASYYTRWKANVRGVDLNRNWNCNWKKYSGAKHPCSENYKGPSVFSEKETKVLKKEVERLKPKTVISYHSCGSIIYWDFVQKGSLQRKCSDLFKVAKSLTGYGSAGNPSAYQKKSNLFPCFGDWVANYKKTPTLTIETGRVQCPIPIKYFKSIWKENQHILPAVAYFVLNDTTVNFSSLKSNSKGFTVTAKKNNSKNFFYQIEYSKSAKMTKKDYAESPASKGVIKVSDLSGNKKYYVRIRTVKKYGLIKIYGKFSKIKSVKTKN